MSRSSHPVDLLLGWLAGTLAAVAVVNVFVLPAVERVQQLAAAIGGGL